MAVDSQIIYMPVAGAQPVNVQLGFNAQSVIANNPTNQWILLSRSGQLIAPYTLNQTILLGGTQQFQAEFTTPVGITTPGAIVGQIANFTCYSAFIPPTTGFSILSFFSSALRQALVFSSVNQSCANNALTVLAFDSAISNPNGLWTPAAPTRLTSQVAGNYLLSASVGFQTDAGGSRQLVWRRNGTDIIYAPETNTLAANPLNMLSGGLTALGVGDYVELCAFIRNAGGALNALAATLANPYTFQAGIVGPFS